MTSVSLDRIAQAFGMDAPKENDSHQYATVDSINVDGSYQVQMNGATNTTRAAKLCNAAIGDRVLCVVQDGQVAAIGRVGAETPYTPPSVYTGTITKVYTSNGFKLESSVFHCRDNVVTIPIQFVATSNFAGNGTTVAASIPAEYAPKSETRFPLFCVNLTWSSITVGYGIIKDTGNITFYSQSAAAWFGFVTYVRG